MQYCNNLNNKKMSNKNIDPTLGALLISAITGLILRIRVKVRKKKTNGDEANVDIDFEKQSKNEEVKNEK